MSELQLSETENAALQRALQEGSSVQQYRVEAILFAAEGKTLNEIAEMIPLRVGQISYWLRRFTAERTDLFAPTDDLSDSTSSAATPISRPDIATSSKAKPDISADDPMSEAGRKIMAYYLARLLNQERAVRDGDQTEAIHDMRVASRRLRSALEIFGSYYKERALKPIRKNLRRIGKTLGAVRDLEVVLNRAHEYAQDLEPVPQESIRALLTQWQSQLDEARQQLLEELDSQRYANFLTGFAEFVNTPNLDAIRLDSEKPKPYFVRDVVPLLVYERYADAMAYGPVFRGASLDTIHALRIEAKGLRYTLEAFEAVLGPEAKTVIEAAKLLQEQLGHLQDERVIASLIQQFIREAGEYEPLADVLQYLAVIEAGKVKLLETLAADWSAFSDPAVRKALNAAVAAL